MYTPETSKMKKKSPPPLALALTIARVASGWSGKELSAAAKIAQSTLSQYESGKLTLSRERYNDLVAVMDNDTDLPGRSLVAATIVGSQGSEFHTTPFLTFGEQQLVRKAGARALTEAVGIIRDGLKDLAHDERLRRDRERAKELWGRLKKYSESDRRVLVEGASEYHEWALSVLLCHESERRAAHDPAEALGLSELALLVAENVEGPEPWRFRLSGQAWIFIANAKRVANDLASANEFLSRGWHFWNTGEDSLRVLDEGYLFDIEASLRREERCFEAALELHEKALLAARKVRIGAILLNKAFTLKEKGDYNESIQALLEAREFVSAERDPRLFFGLQFNLAANLIHAGRAAEAVPLVRYVRGKTDRTTNFLDFLRGLWLEGNLAAALGDRTRAIGLITQVCEGFRERSLSYDFALAALDLALIYGESGTLWQIKKLVADVLVVFRESGVHNETITALISLEKAVESEQVTAASVRRLQRYIERSRKEPGLEYASL